MASATSSQAKPNIGTTPTIIQSKVTEIGKSTDGNRQFNTEIQKVEGSTTTTIGTMDAAGKVTPAVSANSAEKTALADMNSPLRKEVTKQIKDPIVEKNLGVTTDQDKKALNAATGSGAATNGGTTPTTTPAAGITPTGAAALAAENKFKKGTRLSYSQDMRYPLNMRVESQDVIKFSILEYSPSLAKGKQSSSQFGTTQSRVVELDGGNPIIKGSKRIGIITLPIPAGINDSNTVGWTDDKLSQVQSEAANLAQGFLTGGVEGAGESIDKTKEKLNNSNKSGDLNTALTSLFIGSAVSNSNIGSRTFGAVGNNNTELLFNGPSLRSHSFTFSFYPRSPEESVRVRQIIRAFKQSMSVKRSETSLLLKAPHTFAIQYMTSKEGKSVTHPYLTRFKECALTSCNVDYTPDGTYMTYAGVEKSMTAYRMGLTFQELEPIFDDEYGEDDDNVGF